MACVFRRRLTSKLFCGCSHTSRMQRACCRPTLLCRYRCHSRLPHSCHCTPCLHVHGWPCQLRRSNHRHLGGNVRLDQGVHSLRFRLGRLESCGNGFRGTIPSPRDVMHGIRLRSETADLKVTILHISDTHNLHRAMEKERAASAFLHVLIVTQHNQNHGKLAW